MLTDAPPRKNRAGFLESDRIRTLDLPQNGCLLAIGRSIESAMKAATSPDVRRACAEFLGRSIGVVPSSRLRSPRACSPAVASPRELRDRTLR